MLRRLRCEFLFIVLPLVPLATGCVDGHLGDAVRTRDPNAAGSGSGAGSGPGSNAGSDPGSNAGSTSLGSAGSGDTSSPLLPARIRRLSNAEYENSARALVGSSDPVTADFAPDTRQGGYTLNDAQRVDS